MIVKLNIRFLIKFIVVLAVVLGAIHFWHRRQATKQVEQFRHLAQKAKEEKKPDIELRYLSRYLALRPNDVDVRERFGRVRYERSRTGADTAAAYLILEEALRRDPSRKELKRYIVDVALDPRLQYVSEAAAHLDALLSEPNQTDGELYRLRGVCYEVANDLVKAGSSYEKAIQLSPGNIDAYVQLAFLIQRVKDPVQSTQLRNALEHEKAKDESVSSEDLANTFIEELVANNQANYRAHLAAGNYWRYYGGEQAERRELVRSAIETAYRIDPDQQETILARAALDREHTGTLAAFARMFPLVRPLLANSIREGRANQRTLLDRGLTLEAPPDEKEKERKQFLALVPRLYQARADVELDDAKLDEAEAVLLKGTESVQEPADLWWALADVRIRRNNQEGANEAIEELKKLSTPAAFTDYFKARIEVLNENWSEAAGILGRIQEGLAGTIHYKPANLLLARCYEQIGEFDRRIDTFNRILADKDVTSPYWLPATLGLAEARTALGQNESAIELYQSIALRYPGAWLAIARIRMTQAIQQPEGTRDLKMLEDAIDRASPFVSADNVDLGLLKSDLLFLQKKNAEARKRLTELMEKHDKDVQVWIAMAVQDLRDKDRTQAIATLDNAKQKLGDSATLRLARAQLVIDPKSPDAAEQIKALTPTEKDGFPKADQLRLARGLAPLAAAAGDQELAGNLWTQAAAVAPEDLGILLKLFDRSQRAGTRKETERILDRIREIEKGDGTTFKTARAIYHLSLARDKPKDENHRKEIENYRKIASDEFDELEKERPGLSRVALGQAALAEMRNDTDKVIEKLQKAVDQGEKDSSVVVKLIMLLDEKGRKTEIQALMGKLSQAYLETAEGSRLAVAVLLQSNKPQQAMSYMGRAFKADSEDYLEQMTMARAYWIAGDKEKSEVHARKAVAGSKGDPAPLMLLVEMLIAKADTQQEERIANARNALEKFIDTVTPEQRAFAKASCLRLIARVGGNTKEAVEDRKEALEQFVQAEKERPEDVRILQAYAEFLLEEGQPDKSREKWEKVISLQTATEADRRRALLMTAICTSIDGSTDDKLKREALARLNILQGETLKDPEGMSPEELRNAAVVLSLQVDRASKVQAIRYLNRLEEALNRSGRVMSASDFFLRGRLHVMLNEHELARKNLLRALTEEPNNAVNLSYFIMFAIRQNQPGLLSEAARWFKNLKAAQPVAFRTIELEARLAVADKKKELAQQILKAEETKSNAPLRRWATVYEELGLMEDAGRLFKKIGDESKRPEALLIYAAYLGRQKKTDKALDRCDEARTKSCPLAAVSEAGVLVLYDAHNPRPTDIARVMAWINDGLNTSMSQSGTMASLLNQKAAIFNLQGQYDDAIAVYERLLALNARDSLAMNNLGYLLAAHKHDFMKAFAWLVKAKGVSGPIPEYVDTEALIHLARAKAESAPEAKMAGATAALKLLGDVEVQAPSAVTYFHLALARLAAGDNKGAETAWNEAGERKLALSELHPLERSDYERVRSQFGEHKSGKK